MFKKVSQLVSTGMLVVLLFTACRPSPIPTPTTSPTTATVPATLAAPTPTRLPPTPTKIPTRSLVVCLGQEPPSLYLYGSSSRSTWAVLEAVYDGPFDTRNYGVQPVILEKLPSLADGSALIAPVKVKAGDPVVDASGALVNIQRGTRVQPAGCGSSACAVTWDGSSDLQMDQMTVKFQIKPGIKWSDGAPLTAADSVYSFTLTGDSATPVDKAPFDRTAGYKADGDLAVQWVGRPGYFPTQYETLFYTPLPRHLWEKVSPANLVKGSALTERPLGWGAYTIQEWVRGSHITLKKNPNYFRAAEGLPKFENLVYRFLGEQSDNNLAALLTGECDIVDQSTLLHSQLQSILELQKNKKLKAYIAQGPEWEHLDFSIRPYSYDDGYNPAAKDRADFFGDVRVRKAFAACIDRESIVKTLLFEQSSVPGGYLPPGHPFAAADLKPEPYNPAQGAKWLDEAGWKDHDNDPSTPRRARGIATIPDNTPMLLSLYTTSANLRQRSARQVADLLNKCGVQVEVQVVEAGDLFGPGPDGPIFGRKFDLVQFSWRTGPETPCYLYATNQIPRAENGWVGANITGYSNPVFDAACEAAQRTRPDQPDYREKYLAVQRLFYQEMPVIPLYFQLKIAVSRPDLCGLTLDLTSRSELWSLESLDYGAACPK
jgi:peptide/nickel transport system substrate-binding protein